MPRTFYLLPFLLLPGLAVAEENQDKAIAFGSGKLTPSLEAGFSSFNLANPQFGGGSNSPAGERAGRRDWLEGYVKPGLMLEQPLGETTLYTGLSFIAAFTRGNGDGQATSGTAGRPEHAAVEDAVIGWRSGSLLADWDEDALDISFGNQPFAIGDGFLIVDGTADGGRRGAYTLGPRSAFERTAILRLNTAPIRADLFHLAGRSDQKLMRGTDSPATSLYGANLEWFGSKEGDAGRSDYTQRAWYLGATWLHVYDADASVTGSSGGANRDGLGVYALRFGGSLPGLSDLGLYGEYAIQRNDKAGSKVRASAWYLEPQYTVSALPWQPRLAYRFSRFSGDGDTNDSTDREWDALFSSGGARGIGTWTQGEIYGNYVGGNANLRSQMLHLSLQPDPVLTLGLLYFRHDHDALPTGASSRRLMDEVDAYGEWQTPLPGLTLTLIGAMGRPGAGQKQAATANNAGNGEAVGRSIWLGQVSLRYEF